MRNCSRCETRPSSRESFGSSSGATEGALIDLRLPLWRLLVAYTLTGCVGSCAEATVPCLTSAPAHWLGSARCTCSRPSAALACTKTKHHCRRDLDRRADTLDLPSLHTAVLTEPPPNTEACMDLEHIHAFHLGSSSATCGQPRLPLMYHAVIEAVNALAPHV